MDANLKTKKKKKHRSRSIALSMLVETIERKTNEIKRLFFFSFSSIITEKRKEKGTGDKIERNENRLPIALLITRFHRKSR